MLVEDNNGYVNFPTEGKNFIKLDSGKTAIYLVAFTPNDASGKSYILSNNRLILPGNFVSDDVIKRPVVIKESIDDLISNQIRQDEYDSRYFPNIRNDGDDIQSISLTTSICLGWSDFSWINRETCLPWSSNFRDLTNEGRKLYYSIKKLHNNKEVRILTFNNI